MEELYLNKKENLVISIVSLKSNIGKTTLIEKLIKIFKEKNYTVGVLKHDAHRFDIDKEGKDSYKFAQAGADNVIISSKEKLAMIKSSVRDELEIDEILKYFGELDIIIVEGFKDNNYPKIEVHRKDVTDNLLYRDKKYNTSSFIAIASDENLDVNIPILDIDDAGSVADFIEDRYMKNCRR